MSNDDKPKVRVLAMGEEMAIEPATWILRIEIPMPNEDEARHIATTLARMLMVINVQGMVMVLKWVPDSEVPHAT